MNVCSGRAWATRLGRMWGIAIAILACSPAARALPAEDQMRFADGIYLRDLYDMAIQEYLILLRDHPKYDKLDAAFFRLAESYRHTGNKVGAERFYRRLLDEYPKSEFRFRAEFRRAELFAGGGQYLDAVSLFRALIAANPPPDLLAPAWYYLGYSLDKLRIQVEAEKAFKEVIQRFPESPFHSYACLALAEMYQRAGGRDADLRELYGLATNNPATPRVAAEALFQQAELAFKSKEYDAGARLYAQLMTAHPGDYRAAEGALHAAWSSHNAGRYEEGLELARAALAKPDAGREEEWLYVLANCQRQSGREREAVATYTRLLGKYPKARASGLAVYERALAQFKQGDFAGVVGQGGAVPPAPEVAEDFYWMMGESYLALSNQTEALRCYSLFGDKLASSDRAPAALYRAAGIRRDRQEYELASETYRRVARDFPKDALAPEAWFASAFCRAKAGQDAEAVADWTALLDAHPDHARAEEALFQKGAAELRLDLKEPAGASLKTLLERYPGTSMASQARHWLGMLAEQSGDLDAAEREMRAALEGKPARDQEALIRYHLSLVLQKRGKQSESADVLQSLLTEPARPDMSPSLLEWLARYRLESGAFKEAAQAAAVLVKAAGSDPAWKQIGWCLAGRGLQASNEPEKARKAYERALEQPAHTADGAEAAFYLAGLSLDSGAYDKADELFQKAAEWASQNELMSLRARSYFGLAKAAGARNKWDQAGRYYMSVAVLFDDPELSPEALARAAEAFQKAGREAERKKALDELNARYPESSFSSENSLKAQDSITTNESGAAEPQLKDVR